MTLERELSLSVPPELLDALAARVAERLAQRLADPPEAYLNVADAAEYLCCPASRLYELKAQGRVRYFNDGRRLLFRRPDLDACLKSSEPA
ncbi:MAG: helix-turn-helix domain-containing protein [Solirubrobacterales bacterium]|nr:helix-turn-helix domain-containing protein [Solirubrobacterales bacterium]